MKTLSENLKAVCGSGWGTLSPGYELTHISQFKEGRLVLCLNTSLMAYNVAYINSGYLPGDDRVYMNFVDPQDTSKKRLPDDGTFCLWDFHIGAGKDRYFSVL